MDAPGNPSGQRLAEHGYPDRPRLIRSLFVGSLSEEDELSVQR